MKNRFVNIGAGFLYFYIHFVTEVVCFFLLGKYLGTGPQLWVIVFIYDMLAFVPQAIIGYISDRHSKIPFDIIGLILLIVSLPIFKFVSNPFVSLIVLCLGNGCTHISGAQVTLRSSNGSLSSSAIFVSGGSFGVITGKLLSGWGISFLIPAALVLTALPFAILARFYVAEEKTSCKEFNYSKKNVAPLVIIILTVFIVTVRGYMGYGIPTSWKKTVWQTVLLFVVMGTGKALGGVFADLFGARKVALITASAAVPFLMLGDNYIVVSLIGVMLFSMTMSITLGILVSVLPKTPGLAFGLTTLGLFLGTVPIFFFKFTSTVSNCIIIAVLTAVCLICFNLVMRKETSDV